MTTFTAEQATDAEYDLAEGILWDDRASLVRWVDIWKGRVLSGALRDGRIVDIASIELGQTTGAVALAEDGGLLVAAARGLATISPDGAVSFGPDLLGDRARGALQRRLGRPAGPVRRRHPRARRRDRRGGPAAHLAGRLRRDAADRHPSLQRHRLLPRRRHDLPRRHDRRTRCRATPTAPARSTTTSPGCTVLDGPPALPRRPHRRRRRHAVGRAVGRLQRPSPRASPASCSTSSPSTRPRPRARRSSAPTSTTLAITTAQEGLEDWTDASGAIFLADVGATGLPVPRWAGSTTTPYWNNDKEALA